MLNQQFKNTAHAAGFTLVRTSRRDAVIGVLRRPCSCLRCNPPRGGTPYCMQQQSVTVGTGYHNFHLAFSEVPRASEFIETNATNSKCCVRLGRRLCLPWETRMPFRTGNPTTACTPPPIGSPKAGIIRDREPGNWSSRRYSVYQLSQHSRNLIRWLLEPEMAVGRLRGRHGPSQIMARDTSACSRIASSDGQVAEIGQDALYWRTKARFRVSPMEVQHASVLRERRGDRSVLSRCN